MSRLRNDSFLNDSFHLCHGLVMTGFDWFQDVKGRYLYCHHAEDMDSHCGNLALYCPAFHQKKFGSCGHLARTFV